MNNMNNPDPKNTPVDLEELEKLLSGMPEESSDKSTSSKTPLEERVSQEELDAGKLDAEKHPEFVDTRIQQSEEYSIKKDSRFETKDTVDKVLKYDKGLSEKYKELAKPTDAEKAEFVRSLANLKKSFETTIYLKDVNIAVAVKARTKYEDQVILRALELDFTEESNPQDGLAKTLQNIRYYSALVSVKSLNQEPLFFDYSDLPNGRTSVLDKTKSIKENANFLRAKTEELIINELDTTGWFIVNTACSIFENKMEQLRNGVINKGFFPHAG